MKIALALFVLAFASCGSAPMAADARGPNGERLPDVCYQWTFSGVTKAVACQPAPKN